MKFLSFGFRSLTLGAALTLVACGTTPTREQPLKSVVPLTAPVLAPGVYANSDKLFVVVTFSGGGKRAAAFSFGVLEALRDIQVTTPDGEQHPLLDEIDLISAVSGGAFTAAYYALNGKEAFEQLRAALPQSRHRKGSVAQGARAGRTGHDSPRRR